MSLRSALTVVMSALALLTMLAAGSLVILTTYLHHAASELRAGIESLRLVEEAQVNALIHERAIDPLVRAELEQELRRTLEAARGYVTSAEERAVMARVEEEIDAYLGGQGAADDGAGRGGARVDRAFRALDALIEVNVDQARAAEAKAARWDRLGNVLGMSVATVLLVGVAGSLFWIRAFAFRPVLATADAMHRFGAGEKGARAPEVGPRELREIATRFNEMARSLSRHQERQMTFLAGVAHDLRNPLSALRFSTALVPPDRPLPSEERIRSTIALFRRQVDRLERMLGDFLDTARVEAGQLDLKLERGDAREIVGGVLELFQGSSPAHVVTLAAPDTPVALRCDPARVEQVLNNLVSNAIKYSPAGGAVAVRVELEGEHAVISVSDQGIGVPPAEQPRLFEPFRRAGSSASGIPGVGLGLFVARRIVEAHGGRIELQSAPGEGSTFTIRLPCEGPGASVADPGAG